MKFKNLVLQSLLTGFIIISIFNLIIGVSFQKIIKNNDFNLKTNGLDESWNISTDFYGVDMVVDSNNCIYILASEHLRCLFGCYYYGDVIIMKYNNSGNQLWKISLEGLSIEDSGIAIDSKTNLYLASKYENQTLEENMILLKYNSLGNLQWQKTWSGGDNGDIIDIAIDSDDNIYVYGTSDFVEEFNFHLFIVKYNNSGDQQWFHVYEELGEHCAGWDIEINSNDNIIVSGATYTNENNSINYSYWIRCYNQSGELNWETFNEKGVIETLAITLAIDSLDEIISVNSTSIAKFNISGNLLWEWTHQIEFCWQIQIDIDSINNIYVATSIDIPDDHYTSDLYLIKINASGDFDWYLTWGGADKDNLKSISIDSLDNIFLLSDNYFIKNPKNNNKSLTNIKLLNFYFVLLVILSAFSAISLFLVIKGKIR